MKDAPGMTATHRALGDRPTPRGQHVVDMHLVAKSKYPTQVVLSAVRYQGPVAKDNCVF
jgi:hypothetical protein